MGEYTFVEGNIYKDDKPYAGIASADFIDLDTKEVLVHVDFEEESDVAKKKEVKEVETPQVEVVATKKKLYRFEEGDPRNDMTADEIAAFAEQEDNKLNAQLGKFALANPQNESLVEEAAAEDEEEETYSVDLSQAIVTKKSGGEDEVVTSEPMVKANPYTNLVTNILVMKAAKKISKDLDTSVAELHKQIHTLPVKLREVFSKEAEKLADRKYELTRCMNYYVENSENIIIPDWAELEIRQNISRMLNDLLGLAD